MWSLKMEKETRRTKMIKQFIVFTTRAACVLAVLACLGTYRSPHAVAAPAGQLLYRGTSEFGWSHSGVQGWGSSWGRRARNEALGQIQRRIASMVNLGELNTFTKRDNNQAIKSAGKGTYGYGEGKLAWASSKSSVDQQRWVNRNNFLIDVSNVRIKPGTDYSKTRGGSFPSFKRSWHASATMIYNYAIYGNPKKGGSSSKQSKIWIENKTNNTIHYKLNGTRHNVKPDSTRWHKSNKFKVEYDRSFRKGYQLESYTLTPGSRNYFRKVGRGLELYHR
eukprot:GHVQ01028143.1.p1 GENE.GHVQ01028143.1~~GHVQ01028143.1.p1  ORF type:complete len:278 (-),score=11.21 GHVQ01028143.1:366-1199(-)